MLLVIWRHTLRALFLALLGAYLKLQKMVIKIHKG